MVLEQWVVGGMLAGHPLLFAMASSRTVADDLPLVVPAWVVLHIDRCDDMLGQRGVAVCSPVALTVRSGPKGTFSPAGQTGCTPCPPGQASCVP